MTSIPGISALRCTSAVKTWPFREHPPPAPPDCSGLKAIETGTYGRCSVCGRAIPEERLEAIPETQLCVECSRPGLCRPYRPPHRGETLSTHLGRSFDEVSWEEAARHGTAVICPIVNGRNYWGAANYALILMGGAVRLRYVLTSFLILVADRLSKILVMQHMAEGEHPHSCSVLYLTYVRNTGAAFGLLREGSRFGGHCCTGVALAAWQWKRIVSQGSRVKWGLAAALAGALGNMIDRLAYGSVVDFFDIRIWPIFNIADLAISCGIVLLFWEVLSHDQS